MRMSWESYSYIKDLIESKKERLQQEYLVALSYIPQENAKSTGRENAYNIFSKKLENLRIVEEELFAAAASTYKNHPNIEMRQFWKLKE